MPMPPRPEPRPTPANQTSVYSLDGTRSVLITGDAKDAYLYDLTADPDSAAAQGKYLASGISNAAFVNAADGTVGRIILTTTDETGATVTLAFDETEYESRLGQKAGAALFSVK